MDVLYNIPFPSSNLWSINFIDFNLISIYIYDLWIGEFNNNSCCYALLTHFYLTNCSLGTITVTDRWDRLYTDRSTETCRAVDSRCKEPKVGFMNMWLLRLNKTAKWDHSSALYMFKEQKCSQQTCTVLVINTTIMKASLENLRSLS